jgi:hypothetical protein
MPPPEIAPTADKWATSSARETKPMPTTNDWRRIDARRLQARVASKRGHLLRGHQYGVARATARVAIFAFSWLTKPFESRKTRPCNVHLCFPFSHHEQNKNNVDELQ